MNEVQEQATPASSDTLDRHKTPGNLNDALDIRVTDEPGPGGAHHEYEVLDGEDVALYLNFQKGGIEDNGINGITHEVLIAIIMHRLECFQAGPFPAPENIAAWKHLGSALQHLQIRTRDRMDRGVEGKEVA